MEAEDLAGWPRNSSFWHKGSYHSVATYHSPGYLSNQFKESLSPSLPNPSNLLDTGWRATCPGYDLACGYQVILLGRPPKGERTHTTQDPVPDSSVRRGPVVKLRLVSCSEARPWSQL